MLSDTKPKGQPFDLCLFVANTTVPYYIMPCGPPTVGIRATAREKWPLIARVVLIRPLNGCQLRIECVFGSPQQSFINPAA